jgi:hypothetical protein
MLTHCVPTLAQNRKLNHKHYLTLTINVRTLFVKEKVLSDKYHSDKTESATRVKRAAILSRER